MSANTFPNLPLFPGSLPPLKVDLNDLTDSVNARDANCGAVKVDKDIWWYETGWQKILNATKGYGYREYSLGTLIRIYTYCHHDDPTGNERSRPVNRTMQLRDCVLYIMENSVKEKEVKRTWTRWGFFAVFKEDPNSPVINATMSTAMNALGIGQKALGVVTAVVSTVINWLDVFADSTGYKVTKDVVTTTEWAVSSSISSRIISESRLDRETCENLKATLGERTIEISSDESTEPEESAGK